jgi:hypothetical protein
VHIDDGPIAASTFLLASTIMRLLRSATLEPKEFTEDIIPRYAILSHTWGIEGEIEEVTYEDIMNPNSERKAGYQKIKSCGERAAIDGLEYIWVDTCCIDKQSSAELSEAINSMFRWYKNAKICYVYLSDVSAADPPHPIYPTVSTVEKSRWFTRGWTLQELIAPSAIVFFDRDWHEIGTKESLIDYLDKITTIDVLALAGEPLSNFSVARRMSWAAKRETTRAEDIAYSLMGIFDIHMPLLYGEGEKSFIRLQEEIMRNSDDQSIFAWKRSDFYRQLLARSPNDFAESRNIFPLGILGKSGPFAMTNSGLQVSLFLIPCDETKGIYRACLDCQSGEFPYSPAIYLKKLTDYGSQYIRIRSDTLDKIGSSEKSGGEYASVYVRQHDSQLLRQLDELRGLNLFSIETRNKWGNGDLIQIFPTEQWDPQTEIFQTPVTVGKAGALLFELTSTFSNSDRTPISLHLESFVLVFGLSPNGNAWCQILNAGSRNVDQIYESYTPNGTESSESSKRARYAFGGNINAKVITRNVYGFPIFYISGGDYGHDYKVGYGGG